MYIFYYEKIKLEYVDMLCKITKITRTSKIGYYILNDTTIF